MVTCPTTSSCRLVDAKIQGHKRISCVEDNHTIHFELDLRNERRKWWGQFIFAVDAETVFQAHHLIFMLHTGKIGFCNVTIFARTQRWHGSYGDKALSSFFSTPWYTVTIDKNF